MDVDHSDCLPALPSYDVQSWHIWQANLKAAALRNKGQRSRSHSVCHLDGFHPSQWRKAQSLSQVLHCNPAEVAYRAYCLCVCCLSSFPATDSSLCTHGHAVKHTHIQSQTFACIHSALSKPHRVLRISCRPEASTDRGRGGRSNEMFDLYESEAPSLKFYSGCTALVANLIPQGE